MKKFYSQPFRHWQAAASACKVHAEGKKKIKKAVMSHANHCIVKHGLLLVISWFILRGSGTETEVMLTENSDKEVQKNRNNIVRKVGSSI